MMVNIRERHKGAPTHKESTNSSVFSLGRSRRRLLEQRQKPLVERRGIRTSRSPPGSRRSNSSRSPARRKLVDLSSSSKAESGGKSAAKNNDRADRLAHVGVAAKGSSGGKARGNGERSTASAVCAYVELDSSIQLRFVVRLLTQKSFKDRPNSTSKIP